MVAIRTAALITVGAVMVMGSQGAMAQGNAQRSSFFDFLKWGQSAPVHHNDTRHVHNPEVSTVYRVARTHSIKAVPLHEPTHYLASAPAVDALAKPVIQTVMYHERQMIAEAVVHMKTRLEQTVDSLLGVKYKFGANDPSKALDCSALVKRLYETVANVNLPRTARSMATTTQTIQKDDIKAGDLVFFNTRGHAFSHVGVYMGEGQFVHASSKAGHVSISSLSNKYYAKRFTGARRVDHNPS